jgi:SAM-dependent methyltransferase
MTEVSPSVAVTPPDFVDEHGYAYFLFHPDRIKINVGDVVYVSLRSHRDTGRATVLEFISDPESQYAGRYKVRYHHDGSTAHARVDRLAPVVTYPERCVIVCASTDDFRRLARAQLMRADHCLDIGCSYGRGTAIMAQHCGSVIGIDLSVETVLAARKAYRHIRFERLDAMKHVEELLTLGRDCSHLFVDIGGNREVETLVTLLPHLERTLSARMIVVKSSKLKHHAELHLAAAAAAAAAVEGLPCAMQPVHGCAAWWGALLALTRTRNAEMLGALTSPAASAPPADTRDGTAAVVEGAPPRRRLHPLDHMQRQAPDGRVICRFHNYGEQACREGAACEFDHEHCNRCGQRGHVARDCTAVLTDIRT